MKKIKINQNIIYPLIVGLIAIGVAIGLFFYYRNKQTTAIINYGMCIILACVGVACIIATLIKLFEYYKQTKVFKSGTVMQLQYVSNECKVYNKRGSIYNITFTKPNGESIVSKNDFPWAEVLAIKCAQEISAKVYKNNAVILTDLVALNFQFAKEINELNAVYKQAYGNVEKIVAKDSRRSPQRQKSKIEQTREQRKAEMDSRPETKDE